LEAQIKGKKGQVLGPRRVVYLIFVLFLISLLLGAEARREAIVVLSEPALIEQLLAERRERPLRRERLHSAEGQQRAEGLRLRKSGIAAAVRKTGAEILGQTELVLNAIHVRATTEDLAALRKLPGVESAEFATQYRLLLDAALPQIQVPAAWSEPAIGGEENAGSGVKIGVLDTGIDQTHPMFSDAGMSAPPGFPTGELEVTNNKVIVARNFSTERSAADNNGHGTFAAAIAAGRRAQAPQASLVGVAPKAYLGNYRVINANGSGDTSGIIRAIDAAVADGMDILNLSLGSSPAPPPSQDPMFRSIQNATSAGVLVVAAAGNNGPGLRTIASPASLPQVLGVGSTTNARRFMAVVKVTAPQSVPGSLAEIPALPGSEPRQDGPLGPVPLADVAALDPSALACPVGSQVSSEINLPPGSLAGKVALIRRGSCFFREKVRNAAAAGAIGAVIYNNLTNAQAINMETSGSQIPSMSIGNADGLALHDFLTRGAQAQAFFDPQLAARPAQPDVLVISSSRGPAPDLVIKPDVSAPGEFIVSATQNANSSGELFDPSRFVQASGTSFSSPMVAGAAALVKQAHPTYRPAQLKSALVNTAAAVPATEEGAAVSAQNAGAGRLDVLAAVRTTVVADPVSLSFGAQSPRLPIRETRTLSITNTGAAGDTFTLSVVPRAPNPNLRVELDRSSLVLAPGLTAQINVTMSNPGLVQTVVEGAINVRSAATSRSINVPYWATFVVPDVNLGGVVSAASFRGEGGLAPGSIVTIFGVGLSASSNAQAVVFPLPTELGGTVVQLNGASVAMLFASASQLNLQIPFEITAGGFASGTVQADGIRGGTFSFSVSQFSPGLFSMTGDGRGPGAILHADFRLVNAQNPARPGEAVLIFGTGLGAVDTPPPLGRPAPSQPLSVTTTTPTVTIGARDGRVLFSGLAPGFAGLYQVNVTVPADLPAGEHPVVLTIGGASSNTVTISVR